MAVISSIIAAIGTALSAVGGFISSGGLAATWGAISGVLGSSVLATSTGGGLAIGTGAAGAAVAAGGTSLLTVGGALAGVALASTAAISIGSMYHSARASAKAQMAQQKALQELTEENTGKLEVNNTAKVLQENSRLRRTIGSLRIPMGITPKQKTEEITQNVFGVDTNTVATATQNMTGLNIAVA